MSDLYRKLDSHESFIVSMGSKPNTVEVDQDEFRLLLQLAHATIHPDSETAQYVREDIANILGDPEEDEDDDDFGIERGYDETQLRTQALHLATQVDMARIAAAHGLESHSDPVGLAEAYLAFLKASE